MVELRFAEKIFFFVGGTTKKNTHCWLYFYGNSQMAEDFVCTISLEFEELCLSFRGKVIPLDFDKIEVTKTKPTFVIGKNTMLRLMENPNADKTKISIKIQKKDEL